MTVIKSLLVYPPSFYWSSLSIFDLNASAPEFLIPLCIQMRPKIRSKPKDQTINQTKTKHIKPKSELGH